MIRKTNILFVLLIVVCFSCKKKEEIPKSQVIQERLEAKVEKWKKTVTVKCRNDALDRAAEIVDSTLIANAKATRDTTGRPEIPDKPFEPEVEIPEDSIDVKRLFEVQKDSILKDSIQKESN